MRLSQHEQQAIKRTIYDLDPNARIYLFGSRADDTKRGGDIDLLVLSDCIGDKERRAIRLQLFEEIGEQKIDIIIASNDTKPFVQIALAQGVLL